MTTEVGAGKNSFIRGAFVLAGASLGAKVIGALFKIPLGNLLGGDGMGVFTIAYNIYIALFVVSTAGLPVAISKMVSEANALGRQDESRRIFYTALTAFSLLGLVFWGALWLGADAFAGLVGSAGAAPGSEGSGSSGRGGSSGLAFVTVKVVPSSRSTTSPSTGRKGSSDCGTGIAPSAGAGTGTSSA